MSRHNQVNFGHYKTDVSWKPLSYVFHHRGADKSKEDGKIGKACVTSDVVETESGIAVVAKAIERVGKDDNVTEKIREHEIEKRSGSRAKASSSRH